MPRKRINPNQSLPPKATQELRVGAHHLRYEREALEFAGTQLAQRPYPTGLYYAILMESFLIHARNINEFFYGLDMARGGKPLYDDDVIVEYFFDAQDPWAKPLANELPDDVRQHINQQLAHITYSRKVGRYGDWDFRGIQQRMCSLVDLFYQSVDPLKVEPLPSPEETTG